MTDPSLQKLDAGPYLVLICLAFMLFGVLVAQIYYYWLTYKQDKPTLRFYVGAISLMAVLHATFSMIMIYDYYVTFFGDTANGLRRITWSALALTIVQMVFVSLTQALCVSRIWYMSDKSVIVTAIPGALVLCRFALAIACFVFMCMSEFWLDFCSAWRPRLTVNFGFVVSVLTDAATSLILVYYLATNRGTTPTTTNVLNKLMIYVVNTGAITVVFSLGVLLLFNFVRNSLLFAGVYIMLGMLYANTMLAMLNARRTVLTKLHSEHSRSSPIELSTRARAYDGRIHIHTETEVVAVPGNNLARNSIRTSSSPRDSPLDELKAPDTYCYSVQAV